MDFAPQNENEEASLIVFLSNAFYFKLVKKKNDGKSVLILEKRADDFRQTVSCVDIEEVPVFLHIEADRLQYRFYYGYDKNEKRYLGSASARFLSCELAGRCFTGTFVGLYASGNGHRSKQPAHFDYFTLMNQEYSEKL